jgi:hypothetical protein
MEIAMLRWLAIFTTLLVAETGPVQAQYQEAVLQRMVIPGAGFDLLLATPKSASTIDNIDHDALVVRLIGGTLILSFENVEAMFRAIDLLEQPIHASWIMTKSGASHIPISVYLVPARAPDLAGP